MLIENKVKKERVSKTFDWEDPTTRYSLLKSASEGSWQSIEELCSIYMIFAERRLEIYRRYDGLDALACDEIRSDFMSKFAQQKWRDKFIASAANRNFGSVRAYLGKTLNNCRIDYLRSRNRQPTVSCDILGLVTEENDDQPDDSLDYYNEIAGKILEKLPLTIEEVSTYLSVTLLGKSQQEVAGQYGVSRSAIYKRIIKVRSTMLANLRTLTPEERSFYEATLISNEEEYVQLSIKELYKKGLSKEEVDAWLNRMNGESIQVISERQSTSESDTEERIARIERMVVDAFSLRNSPKNGKPKVIKR